MRILLVLIAGLSLMGCSTMSSSQRNELTTAWTGQPLIKLERHPEFGVPTQKTSLSDGTLAYVYQFNGPVHTGFYAFDGNVYSKSTQTQCMFTFYSKESTITGLNVQGKCKGDSARFPN